METIAAIATAQSPSAIGIVRLSGDETRRVLAALFTPASGMAVEALPYRRMTYGDIQMCIRDRSYTIDVYRGDAKAQKNIINFGAYVTLFPQLIAGQMCIRDSIGWWT